MSHTRSPIESNRIKTNLTPVFANLQKFGGFLLVLAIAAGGYYVSHFLLPGSEHAETAHSQPAAIPEAELNQIVILTPEKLATAGIISHPAEIQEFQPHKLVPGKIAYDASNKVELRAAVDSIVTQALVKPGQKVQAGDELLILTGPEVGQARNAIDRAIAKLDLAKSEYLWIERTHENLLELIGVLNERPSVENIKAAFAAKTLGEHRDAILTAYSKYLLARKSLERGSNPVSRGVIPGRLMDERTSDLEITEARFFGLIEESKFQSQQDLAIAKLNLEAAEKELRICQESLEALLGSNMQTEAAKDQRKLSAPKEMIAQDERPSTGSLFVLQAPRDGRIVELHASNSTRFVAGEVMLVLADTSSVWVEAMIPQRDIQSLDWLTDPNISVTVPGLNKTLSATVRFSDSTVSPSTNAVSLIAKLDNPDRALRPGMFGWVRVPIAKPKRCVVVPASAIQRDDQATFVFVDEGNGRFRRVNTLVGRESDGWIEIESGLNEGDNVVDQGAFFLKSELLLEAE